MIRTSLVLASLLSAAAVAQAPADPSGENEEHYEHGEIERVEVSALPLRRSKLESAQPVDMLMGEELDDRRGLTLGDTLMQQPGVHSTSYGPGAGRPVIRGLGSGRVRILEDSLPAVDVSAQSDDHAVSLEPMLIDRIEVLRGPSTLLFGSGAVGGVVNIIDGRIPEQVPMTAVEGRFEMRGNTVSDERTGVLRLDGGGGQWAWNVAGSWRDADDYEIPGTAEPGGEEETGTLPNSFVESQSGSAGLSWIGSRGMFGVSFKRFDTEYGIPAPHSHHGPGDSDHDHQSPNIFRRTLFPRSSRDGEHDHEDEDVYVDLEQTRWDAKGRLDDPLPGFSRATLRTSYSDYTHAERAVSGAGEHGHADHAHTVFDVEAWSGRLELEHRPVAGWRGALGLQLEDESLAAMGEEAYVPDGDTRSWALFALEEKRSGPLTWTLGARVERNEIEVDERLEEHQHEDVSEDGQLETHALDWPLKRNFTTVSASAGALWQMSKRWQTSLNYAYAERTPTQADLFAEGPHPATFTYERGAVDLGKEVTSGLDLIVHRHTEALDLEAALFYNTIDDFIYLDRTGEVLDGLPLHQTRQQDATFYGGELQAIWRLPDSSLGHFDLRVGYDWVRAEFDSGEQLPRISPGRYTANLDWHLGDLRGSLGYQHIRSARHLAPEETPTAGYDMVDLNLAYVFAVGYSELEAFAKLSNPFDEEARVHTSFLKEFAPLPGRDLSIGLRGRF